MGFRLVWAFLHSLCLLNHTIIRPSPVWLHSNCSSQSHRRLPGCEIQRSLCACITLHFLSSRDATTPFPRDHTLTTRSKTSPLLLPSSHLSQSPNNLLTCVQTLSKWASSSILFKTYAQQSLALIF